MNIYHYPALPRLIAATTGFLLLCIILLAFQSPPEITPDNSTSGTDVPSTAATSTPLPTNQFPYIQIIDSCGPYFEGDCVRARTGPGTTYPAVQNLRTGVVLKTAGSVTIGTSTWYKIVFDEWLRYPNRTRTTMYVASAYAAPIYADEPTELARGPSAHATGTKRIIVDRSDQILYAYDGDVLIMTEKISTGLAFTPTPRGTFVVYKKTPTRYMQGPLPGISDQYYDLPGVPWNLYFTAQGAVIHGAYWHDKFGKQWSHGCINLPVDRARELYDWAELGTSVIVRD